MKNLLGLTVVVLGVLLLLHSVGAYDAVASGVSGLVSGRSLQQSDWMLLGGVVAVLIGVAITAHHRRPHMKA